MKNKKSNRLPKKLWENLLLAIHDLELVEKSKKYSIEMSTWHTSKEEDGKCKVCFAGSVMAMTKEVELDLSIDNTNEHFSLREVRVFDSLDNLRNYDIEEAIENFFDGDTPKRVKKAVKQHPAVALSLMGYESDFMFFKFNRDSYGENPKNFKKNMRFIAEQLKVLDI